MSGQWWESDLIVGPFTNLAAANAWAAANPSSLFPGLLATAGGVQIRWGVGGWTIAYPNVASATWAIGGDSIAAQDGNAGLQALCSSGKKISLRNYALGGTRINEQSQFLSAMAADGCHCVLFQVGSNDIIQGRTPAQIYADCVALISDCRALGIESSFLSIPPVGTSARAVFLGNLAMYRACVACSASYFDPWQDSANAATGQWYGATTGSDLVHPVVSTRISAANVLATQMAKGGSSSPLVRSIADGDSPATTIACTFQNANELNEFYVIGSGVTSAIELYNTNGSNWLKMTAPVSSHGAICKYQAVPCSPGDAISMSGEMLLQAVDEVVGYDDKTRLTVSVMYERSSGGNLEIPIGARPGISPRRFFHIEKAPALATKAYIMIYFEYTSSVSAQIAKLRNIGLTNLTAAGVP